ncbi:MAG: hypothetical protein U9N00_02635 [Candidatus Bipolaricaulota bacterium]|nr:hypothetical protein [Candidatus Bipolaricaulota bacterium]
MNFIHQKNSRCFILPGVLLAGVLTIFLTVALALPAFADHFRQLASEHFLIHYTVGTGEDAVTTEYANLVRDALEEAYAGLIDSEGFSIIDTRIRVEILGGEYGEMGAEYFDTTSSGDPLPVIEIATEEIMSGVLYDLVIPCTLRDMVRSTATHEIFHVIQDSLALDGQNDMSDLIFVEATATWAQEAIVPEANDYLDPALDFLLGPDSIAFFHRTYDAGIFWVFVSSRYGGTNAIKRVLEASADYDGRYAIDAAFQEEGLTFDDLWEEFAIALAAGTTPDADLIKTMFPLAAEDGKSRNSTRWVLLPAPVYTGTWSGTPIDIERVNFQSDAPYSPQFEEDPIGTPLRVAHAYGIDFLDLASSTDQTMEIAFAGAAGTVFRVNVVTQKGSSNTVYQLTADAPVSIERPNEYDAIRIVITRGEAGTGSYSLTIQGK